MTVRDQEQLPQAGGRSSYLSGEQGYGRDHGSPSAIVLQPISTPSLSHGRSPRVPFRVAGIAGDEYDRHRLTSADLGQSMRPPVTTCRSLAHYLFANRTSRCLRYSHPYAKWE